MTAAEIKRLLARKYRGGGWFMAFEVRDRAADGQAHGYADAVAMGIWPSHGYKIHIFEIKISRSDWQSEMVNPAKSQRFIQHADHFWVVAPRGIVLDSELPDRWGLMQANKQSLRVIHDAPWLGDRDRSGRPMGRAFVAKMLQSARTATENDPTFGDRIEAARQQGRQSAEYEIRTLQKRLKTYEAASNRYEELFGHSWIHAEWPGFGGSFEGEARRLKLAYRLAGSDGLFAGAENHAKSIIRECENLLRRIEEFDRAGDAP